MRLAHRLPLFLGLLLALGAGAHAETIVKDGDDVVIDGQDYRLLGVDAFEPRQTCNDDKGGEYDCGARAKAALKDIIGDQGVLCQPTGQRDGNRLIARCTVGEVDAEIAIVRAGWAFPRRDFLSDDPNRFVELCEIEKDAREAKRGAWVGTFEIPFVQKGGGRGKKKLADVVCPGFPIAAVVGTTSSAADPVQKDPVVEPRDRADSLARYLGAMLTPAIAILALVIAWAQWRVVRRREVMELFERRLAIYEAIRRVIGHVVPTGKVTNKNLYDFLAGADRARFLFGTDVVDYVEGLYRQLLKHQEAEMIIASGAAATGYQRAVEAKYESFKEITSFYEAFPKLISHYVRMDQKLP